METCIQFLKDRRPELVRGATEGYDVEQEVYRLVEDRLVDDVGAIVYDTPVMSAERPAPYEEVLEERDHVEGLARAIVEEAGLDLSVSRVLRITDDEGKYTGVRLTVSGRSRRWELYVSLEG